MKRVPFLSIAFLLAIFHFALGQIPRTMSYQGVLTDASGVPVPDGNYNLTFKLYEVSAGGSAVWSETQTVAVSEGIFNVLLGSVSLLNLAFDKPYWLGLAIAPGAELIPRIPLASAPYSLNPAEGGGGGWSDDGSVVRLTTVTDSVGIGTADPTEKLEVSGNLKLLDTLFFGISDDAMIYRDGQLVIKTDDMSIRIHNDPAMFIDYGVHVNSTVEMTGFKMPTGAANQYVLTSDALGQGTWQPAPGGGIGGGGAVNYLPKFTGPTAIGNSEIYQSGNNIGIGTATPLEKLEVNGNLRVKTDGSVQFGSDEYRIGRDLNDLRFYTDDEPNLVIQSNGYVGIGTTTPANELSVGGTMNVSGNVGIGTTTPTQKLHVEGNLRLINNGWIQFGHNTDYRIARVANDLKFYTDGDPNLVVLDGGQVGIGTETPQELLDVSGTARVAGFKMPTGAANQYVLTSDAAGVGTWQPAAAAANAWNLTGNSGTAPPANFLGTSDLQPFEIKVNNSRVFRFEPAGSLNGPNLIGGSSVNNVASGLEGATISSGGRNDEPNTITASFATIGGGSDNHANGEYATVAGGEANFANEDFATVGGGEDNQASGGFATVAGGEEGYAAGHCATVGGGHDNEAMGSYATVAGGFENAANAEAATAGGGNFNRVTGAYATVPGGKDNGAAGRYSFAAGHLASAAHDGTFVWADAIGSDFSSTAPNQFLIRASGGVGIRTNTPRADLHVDGHRRYAGYFTSDSASGDANALRAEITGSGEFDAAGVRGRSIPAPYYGYGGYFEGGWIGIEAHAWESGIGSRYGVVSWALGGSTENYGVLAHAAGGATTYGVYGVGNGGSSNNYGVYASGDLAYTGSLIHVSDEKFKENLQPLSGALAIIKRLNARTFTFTGNPQYAHLNFARGKHYGLIAQEVEQVLPELVSSNTHPSASTSRGEKNSDPSIEYKGVNYTELIPILVEAIKEQQQEIESLRAEIQALKEGK